MLLVLIEGEEVTRSAQTYIVDQNKKTNESLQTEKT